MLPVYRSLFLRYGIAVLGVALALLLQSPLADLLESQVPFLLLFSAVIASAWYGGFGPGMVATLLATLGCAYFYVAPFDSLTSPSSEQAFALGLFAVEGVLISLLSAALHRAQKGTEVFWLRSKQHQETLRRSEERYRLLIENVKDYAIFMLDTRGRVTSWNPGAERILGYKEAEILEQHFSCFFTAEDVQQGKPDQEIKQAIAEDRAEDERWHVRKDGSRFYASGITTALRDRFGRLRGFSKLMRDMTERKRTEEALQAAHDQLEAEVIKRTAELSTANSALKEQISERLRTEAWLRDDAERLTAIIDTQHDIATAELDLLRVMNLIAERTQKITSATGAVILLPNGEDMVYRVASGTAAPYVGLRVKADTCFSGQCFHTGEILRCDDAETDPRISPEVYRRVGARSMIAVPLRYERRIAGVLKVLSPNVNAFSEQDTHTLRLMAGFIAAAVMHAAEFEARQAMVVEHTTALAALRESEERFKGAFHDSAVGMALIATDGRFLQVNRSLCQMLGYSDSELLNTNFQAVTHPDDLDRTLIFVCQMLTGEIQAYEMEKRYLHKQGHVVWVLLNVSLVHNSQGEPVHFIAQIQDVTERKQAEEERAQLICEQAARAVAEASEQRSTFLAEASAVLSASLDYEATLISLARLAVPYLADLCVIDMVEDGESLRPLTVAHIDPAKEDLARQLQQYYPLRLSHLRPVLQALQTGESQLLAEVSEAAIADSTTDADYLRLIRSLHPKSVMIVPLIAAGRTIGVISFTISESQRHYNSVDLTLAEDLARRAALAVDNARLYQEAQDANRMKDEFLATLSHELRTPLNSILGWSRLLGSRKFDEVTTAKALETIERNAKSQAQLIEDILDVSRIVQGKLQLQVRPVELITVITAATDAVRPAAEAKGISLEPKLNEAATQVLGDPDRLQQIVWNLLANAIKFTPRGGQVEISLELIDSCIQIRVQDTGQGIPAEFLPHVFDRFRQADSTSTRSHGGLGLGLAIVRHLVELQGGTVSAASPGEGQGATFTVKLPPLVLSASDPELPPSTHCLLEGIANALESSILKGVSVLVVDDENDARELLQTILEQSGANVTAVASVAEAIAAYENLQPDILISDIAMPGEDGYALIHRVKTLEHHPVKPMPAIALTAYAREEDQAQALSAGFQMHFAKPVEPTSLVSALANLLGRTVTS
ncbi:MULTISPECIES: PAS domain S-box protein [Trichocoleus]|uniref:histidine kinase n=1 Tax=Trichocoleus desertorum GB2-A4 TaxID=2933944 RepID=A0ABV0J632_9CYAN|nr:PAS domain S-box protein [Trichocoleus sp. FACHB-46]MBD1863348.1 PAS domain S-box protein [Trichocoleus sp. FACHB-46]